MPIIKAPMTTINLATGEETHGTTDWHMMPVDTGDGRCAECAVKHDADQPHDAQSMAYQYAFYAKHERWPNWADAMAHCSDETQKMWRHLLQTKGQKVGIKPSEKDVGRRVRYFGNTHPGGEIEEGTISSFNGVTVFVVYDGKKTAQATLLEDLGWAGSAT